MRNPVNRRELYARILRDLATQPVTFYPVVLGLTLLLLSAVAGGQLAFLGFLAIIVGAANFLAQLASGKVSRSVVARLEKELTERRERELDDLQRRLASDGDPRTHALLGDPQRRRQIEMHDRRGALQVQALVHRIRTQCDRRLLGVSGEQATHALSGRRIGAGCHDHPRRRAVE